MPRLSSGEKLRLAAMRAERSRRALVSGLLHSRLMRWRFRARGARQILYVPIDLRTADPSFWREFELDHFGMAGCIARLGGRSPFEVAPPAPEWERALHGFGWLRHLDAALIPEAREAGRNLALEWTIRERGISGAAWQADVTARRVISWLQHADLLLDGADPQTYETIAGSLEFQIVRLSASWRDAPAGYPRLLSLLAILLADICVAGHDRHVAAAERAFAAELKAQVLPDGGHVSRNPAVLVELLLDLLPLRQCFVARKRPMLPAITTAIQAMLRHLRFMRMGDGMLARFNGVSVAMPAALSTVIAYEESQGEAPPAEAAQSHYLRLERKDAIVIVDAGTAPPLEVATQAAAGCLSFEMSTGNRLLFVNGGVPGPADRDWTSAARATASHNTLVLDERSSAALIESGGLASFCGGIPIRGPDGAGWEWRDEPGGGLSAKLRHDGYLARHGLVHTRKITLSHDGLALAGEDRLGPPNGKLRLRADLPFAIHFHLNPEASCSADADGGATITLPGGGLVWKFTADGAALSIEESIFYADSAGPRQALQIVLRGRTGGETSVRWRCAADV